MSGHHHHGISHGGVQRYHHRFALGVFLNVGYAAVEVAYGLAFDSLALIADAGHNLSDVLSLLLAWGAASLAERRPTLRRSYGLRRVTILASLLSAVLLSFTIGVITWEAIGRFANPPPASGLVMMLVAGIGVIINTATALLFWRGSSSDLNIKGAFLHMVADASVSAGVVVAGGLILLTGWLWLDPLIGLLVVLAIAAATWGLMRDSVNLLLDAVPDHIDPEAVEKYLFDLPEVSDVHDLHIWSVSTSEVVLTAHLLMPQPPASDEFLSRVRAELFSRFTIGHTTIQIERNEAEKPCQKTVCN